MSGPGRAMMGWLANVITAACLATGCASSGLPTTPKTVTLDQEFELAPAQAANVGDTGLIVSFERVAADSRCPTDVTCIWEGDATVVVTAAQASRETARLELHTSGSQGPAEARYGDFVIRMVRLGPQPRSTTKIEPTDYRLVLRVTR